MGRGEEGTGLDLKVLTVWLGRTLRNQWLRSSSGSCEGSAVGPRRLRRHTGRRRRCWKALPCRAGFSECLWPPLSVRDLDGLAACCCVEPALFRGLGAWRPRVYLAGPRGVCLRSWMFHMPYLPLLLPSSFPSALRGFL